MKLETFFEKFELFADAPDAVAKMRELVLDFAIQGGLVPHLPNELPVPYESVEGATPINVSAIPSNWRVVLLADAIKNRSGNSKLIKGKLYEEPAPGRFQGYSASGADVWCDDYEHEGEAIIISAVGARCGKAFKAAGKWSAIANTNIARPEPSLFDFDFAYLVLNNEHFWVRGGSAQPFVKFPPSLDRYFSVPPLAEQKRIVAKVDEVMALCDRLEQQQQERDTRHAALARAALARFSEAPTPANLDFLFHPSYTITPADLRKSILTLAVQGKLVPQDQNEPPAAVLLNEIKQEKRRLAHEGRIKADWLSKPTDEDAPHQIPESWKWERLGNVVEFRTGKLDANAAVADGSFPFFTCAKEAFRINDYAFDCEAVLLSGNNAQGKYDVKRYSGKFNAYQRTYVITAEFGKSKSFDYGYLKYLLEYSLEEFQQKSIGTLTRYLTLGILRPVAVPLPPLAEQSRIVAKVDQLMALVDQLETQLTASRSAAEKLMQAVVAELTAQE